MSWASMIAKEISSATISARIRAEVFLTDIRLAALVGTNLLRSGVQTLLR